MNADMTVSTLGDTLGLHGNVADKSTPGHSVVKLKPNLRLFWFEHVCETLRIVEVTHQSFYYIVTFKCAVTFDDR